jgi:hypothetical protein
MDIVCEAIEQRIGETLALENARQFLEWKILTFGIGTSR